MRSPIYLELTASSFQHPKLTRPDYKQRELNALAVIELVRDFGRLLNALPEDAQGQVHHDGEARYHYEQLCFALNGLGALQTALAEYAWEEVSELAKLAAAAKS